MALARGCPLQAQSSRAVSRTPFYRLGRIRLNGA
jgi:hypothetical protein